MFFSRGKCRKKKFSSFRIIIVGFLAVILLGCVLLMLPISSNDGRKASLLEALFTSTSAVCVTGLAVVDTASGWSFFGQLVILLLIQVGGMGVVTIAVALTMFSGRKVSLMQRSAMQDAISAPNVGDVIYLTGFILKTTIMLELVGAVLMFPVFCRDFGLLQGLWYALFHSVSAFCNAGFDLMGAEEPYSSLTGYSEQPVVILTVMALIVIGGIGFVTWEDFRRHGLHFWRFRMQSKVILTMTGILVLLPAVYFFFCEFSGSEWRTVPFQERVLYSLFQSVTPRTAGFNTIDLNLISEPGQVILILLMLIGGSPGSTAGGLKTTTAAVLCASALAVYRRREEVTCFNRRIASDTVKYAAGILLMYLGLFLFGGLFISCVEKLPVLPCFFETASAVGTVGLTLGITPALSALSEGVLILLMFFGRVGPLTLAFAALSGEEKNISKLPQEKITVG